MNSTLAQAVLALHLAVIAFNVAGLAVIPLGARLGWRFVRWRGLRLLHLASWAVVAVQASLGRACFLTDWQGALSGDGAQAPMVMRWINGLIYWPLPMWAFTVIYLALFAWVVALWRIAPPNPRPSSGRR
jgi:hypothetical protein